MSGSPQSDGDTMLIAAINEFRDWFDARREKPTDQECERALCASALRQLSGSVVPRG